MTWDGESLPMDQLRDLNAREDLEDGEWLDALHRILGLVCRECEAPTPLAVLQHHDGRCEACAGEAA